MPKKKSGEGSAYTIRVKETLDQHVTEWFPNLTVMAQDNGETVLAGQLADQAALRGLLDQLWDLNLTVLAVDRIEREGGSPVA
jgi:hypothetical protein